MPDCIFCKIASGAIPSHRLYDDGDCFAFLDIRPLAKGHALVIPKQHAAKYEDLTADQAGCMWKAVHKLAGPLTKAAGASATTLAINNGKEAGQEVNHVHVHIVPRKDGDGAGPIHGMFHDRPMVTPEELAALASQVRSRVK